MTLEERKEIFAILGCFLEQFNINGIEKKRNVLYNEIFFDSFCRQIEKAETLNPWFTKRNILHAVSALADCLTEENIDNWLSSYDLGGIEPKTVAIIMAGNIPLVGFHDFLSVLISGHSVVLKQSSADSCLLPILADYLVRVDSRLKGKISFTDSILGDFDAVIATGSNNTARYFEYYFGKYPHIIRKNRNSVAILTGEESEEELKGLGKDIFYYFGLGCRNVSKIFVPENYDFDMFFKAMYPYRDVLQHTRYVNNYDYNRAVYLMSRYRLLENNFLILKEDSLYSSPIATLFYEYYTDQRHLLKRLKADSEKIQCLVGHESSENAVGFGKTQQPDLSDYADGVDTINFLTFR